MLLTNKTIGERIAYYRKERKLTQLQLANITGLFPRYLSDVETGRKVPEIPTVARFAAGLGVSIEVWLGDANVVLG